MNFILDLAEEGFFDILCDELYWDGGYSFEAFAKQTLKEAHSRGINIKEEDFSDIVFYDIYQNTEKGLS